MMSILLATLLVVTTTQAEDTKTPLLDSLPGQTNAGRLALKGKIELEECRETAVALVPDEIDADDALLQLAPVVDQLSTCASMAAHYKRLMFEGIKMLAAEQRQYPEGDWQRQSIQNVADLVGEDWAYFLTQEADLTLRQHELGFWSAGNTFAATARDLRQHNNEQR